MYLLNFESFILKEGLIKSVSLNNCKDRLIVYLNKNNFFFNVEIDLEDQSIMLDIDFTNKTIKDNSKLMTLINNLGYYPSIYLKNQKRFIVNPLIKGEKKFTMVLNKKFDKSVDETFKHVYHVTLKSLYNKIKNKGLTVRNSKLWEDYPERIYLMSNKKGLLLFATQKSILLKKELERQHKNHLIKIKNLDEWIILKIDTSKIKDFKIFKDYQFDENNAYYTINYIPPKAIKKDEEIDLNFEDEFI